jgi:hypothetical protein
MGKRRFPWADVCAAAVGAAGVFLFAGSPGADSGQLRLAAMDRGGDIPPAIVDELRAGSVVSRIQKALEKAGLYHGTVTGRMNAATRTAIRAHQRRSGLKVDGLATPNLANHLETAVKVDALLRRLSRARSTNIEAARQALLSRSETKHLVTKPNKEVADPTRDSAPCFQKPNVACLIEEASESAKAVFRAEMRDWVLGEILVVQTKAGFVDQAMNTVRRIHDPRLVMVALRDIAKTQAVAGRTREAIEAVDIIPDVSKQIEALADIAAIQAERADGEGARATIARLLAILEGVKDPLAHIINRAKVAVISAQSGDARAAEDHLRVAESLARARTLSGERARALRHVASALAETGNPPRAMDVLGQVGDDAQRTPVLISAATAHARAGNATRALAIAEDIEAERYRAIVLSRIALAQIRAGDETAARDSMAKARSAADDITSPYAKAFAFSRIALAKLEVAILDSGKVRTNGFEDAVVAAGRIGDHRLRAHVLWSIRAEMTRAGITKGAARTAQLADEASADIKSPLSRIWMFTDVALGHAAADELDAARKAFNRGLNIAKKIDNAWTRSRALGRLAGTLLDFTGADQ